MLSYEQLHREIAHRKNVTNSNVPPPQKVHVYIKRDTTKPKLVQISVSDFPNYNFVEYTYAGSLYPVVEAVTKTNK